MGSVMPWWVDFYYIYRMKARQKPTHRQISTRKISRYDSGLKPSMRVRPPWPPDTPEAPVAFGGFAGAACIAPEAAALFGAAEYGTLKIGW